MARRAALLFASFVCGVHCYHVPARRQVLRTVSWTSSEDQQANPWHGVATVGFQRGAVESVPVALKQPDETVYGSQRYPLRDAVEAQPGSTSAHSEPLRDTVRSNERLPLRDAVEHREAPFFDSVDHEAFWIEPLIPPTLRGPRTRAEPKVVCYLDTRAAERSEPFALYASTVPDYKCTHLVYNAAEFDPNDSTIVHRSYERDEIKGGYKLVARLRSNDPALRVLLSIVFREEDRRLPDISDDNLRATILDFLARHDFDGVEVDWRSTADPEEESSNLKSLLKSLGGPLREKGFLLTVSLRSSTVPDPEIVRIGDLVVLRAWRETPDSKQRGDRLALHPALHPAPMKFVVPIVERWIRRLPTRHRSRIVLGAPLFGQGYTIEFGNSTESGAPVIGPGNGGAYTRRDDGRLAYYEVCEKLEDGAWISGRDAEGPFVKRADQWVGYDDPISVKIKAAYARSVGLGGLALSSLDLDDFQGICGNPWPVLNAATNGLALYGDSEEQPCTEEGLQRDPDNCSGFYSCVKGRSHHGYCGLGRFFDATNGRCAAAAPGVCSPGHSDRVAVEQTASRSEEMREKPDKRRGDDGPRVVCYVTSWAIYRKGDGRFVPENIDPSLCTDVVYAFAALNPDTLLVQPFDPWADIENDLYNRVTSIEGPRVLLALGGWTDSSSDKYSRLVSNGASRRKLVAATVSFLRKHNFDGLSLEWNYPKCWQSDCRRGPASDKPNFAKLVQELRREFDAQQPRLTLAVAFSGYKEIIDEAYDVAEISRHADFTPVMTYDYHGAWESKTGHIAPLFGTLGADNPFYNVNFTMEYLARLGADKSKLLVGVPMYGQAYRLSNPNRSGLDDPAAGPGTPGEFTGQPGMLAYYEICERVNKRNWRTAAGPIACHGHQWVGYEDQESVFAKGEYILRNGYGGAAMWTVDLDDFSNRCCVESFPLLKSINRALGRLSRSVSGTGDCRRPPEPVTPPAPTLTTHSDAIEGGPRPTTPVSTTKTTKITTTSTTSTTTVRTTWPTWTEKPSTSADAATPTSGHQSTSLSVPPTRTTWPSWSWTTQRTTTRVPEQTVKTTTKLPPTSESTEQSTAAATPCNTGQYLGDPDNCASYFRCVLGELRREQCAPGLHWDGRRGICDWPSLANCQQELGATSTSRQPAWSSTRRTTRYPTPSTPRWPFSSSTERSTVFSTSWTSWSIGTPAYKPVVIVKPKPGAEKVCEHGRYYSYPDSCTSFLVCVNGNLVSQQCGPGLNWNEGKSMCDWAFKNPCVDKPKLNSLLADHETTSGNCVPGSYTAVPGHCESYRACLWGRHEVFRCAPGLHFNEQTHICDWPSRANCKRGPETENDADSEPTAPFAPTSPTSPTSSPTVTAVTRPTTTSRPSTLQFTTSASTTLSSAEIDPDKVSPLSGHFKVVCYFTNWAWYRRGVGRYLPEHIDHTLCTHIVYGFAVLDYSELTVKPHDSWADLDNRFYERVVAYKKRGLKVLLALGGWNDSAGDKYSRLVNRPLARSKFVEHAVRFIEKYGFDGLDLDWEYPVCWQVNCDKGPASDKQGFAALLKELSAEFRQRGLLLSAAVSPSKKVIDKGYDVPALASYLDWIAVMTYDFHGQWDKKTGHVAPLYHHPDDDYDYFNANFSINYWISKGAPARSIVMGIPLYGQSFSLNDPGAGNGLNAPASAGAAGEFTRAAGFLSYYEICNRANERGWTVVRDPEARMGPYAYKGNQWVSYDDAETVERKGKFVRSMNLGGGMVWALDLDDFRGRCGDGPHPLMRALQRVLAEPVNALDTPVAQSTTTVPGVVASTTRDRVQDGERDTGEFKMICYFTNWAWYRQEGGKFLPEDIDPELCTHVLYGFAVLDSSSLTIKSHDPWADIDNKFYQRVAALKKKGIKVLMAIGGWNDSAGDKYSRLVNSPAARRRFIANVLGFLEKYGFEGLDLDWEYPVCWQVDCKKGPASDKEGFAEFVKELSGEFRARGLLLSAAVSPSKRVIDEGYDVPVLAEHLDWISVMTYDYHGQWDKKTGHVAPLYELPTDWEPTFNANFTIHYWMEKGAPPKKLVMGAPLYGQSFSLAERSQRGLNAPTYGGGEAGEATRARGFLSYYEICERTLEQGWTVVQDSQRRIGPYAYKGDQWVSFDDARQIEKKARFIKDLGLAGGMVWALDLDDFKNRCGCEPSPLLRTMNRVLRNYPKGPLCPVATGPAEVDSSLSPTESPNGTSVQAEETNPPRPTYLPTVSTSLTTAPTTPCSVATTTASPVNTVVPDDGDDTVEIEANPTRPTSPPIGDCGGRLFIPHKLDCSKYYLCNFGKLSEHSCPSGLHWNGDRCDWPRNSKCDGAKRVIRV